MSDIQVTASAGGVINVSTGTVVGPLPQLQVAAGNGITINTSGGVSTISANVAELAIPSNLADLANVNGTPSLGQVLSWGGSEWSPADGVANLADLADVSANSATAGQALTWDGGQWAAANVAAGTTINGLSGAVQLIAGENTQISSSGQNLTISSTGGGGVVSGQAGTSARNLRITRNALGELHLEWDAPAGYTGQYLVDVTPVGLAANVTTTSAASISADGSLAANVSVDAGVSLDRAILFAANGSVAVSNTTEFYATIGELTISGSNATISNAYLPDEFTSPGPVHLMVAAYDVSGFPVGRSTVTTLNVTNHGSPVAPDIVGVSGGNGTIDVSLFSSQTPHQRGFYDFSQIAYVAEINEDANAATGWIRGSGVTADASDTEYDLTVASVAANASTTYYARVIAVNPLGEGQARIA